MNKYPKMIAHRGFSGYEKENTACSFVAAGVNSFYGIECDIHKTIDGEFVVVHDPDLKRVASVDVIIKESTLEELKRIDLLDVSGTKTYSYYKIPTLCEYLSIAKRYNKVSVIEFKYEYSEEDVLKVIDIVKSFDYLEQTVFISFVGSNLDYVKKHYPHQKVQFLTSKVLDNMIEYLLEHHFDLDIYYKALTKELLDECHEKGILVNVWTVNDINDCKNLIIDGVDYITTNYFPDAEKVMNN